MTAVVRSLYICPPGSGFVTERREVVTVTANGFEGDKHATWERGADARAKAYPRGTPIWNSRQLSIVSEEELAQIATALAIPRIAPEWLGANICTRGLPELTRLPPGTQLLIDNVGLYVTALNGPCIGPGKELAKHHPDVPDLAARFVKAALDLRGLVAVVERVGVIHEGAPIKVHGILRPHT
jgi:MOSC domain-containing protein YiiM